MRKSRSWRLYCAISVCLCARFSSTTGWYCSFGHTPACTSQRLPCSASGDGTSISTMTVNEFWSLLRDAQVANAGHGDNKSARLDLIFIKVNQTAGLPDDRVIRDGYVHAALGVDPRYTLIPPLAQRVDCATVH